MSQEERYGSRDLTYSQWHRRKSTGRFIGAQSAQQLSMIDADVLIYIEYQEENKEPVVVIEVAQYVGQTWKPSTVTANLGRRAGIPALCVLYEVEQGSKNPASPEHEDIFKFWVRRLWPVKDSGFRFYTPEEYAKLLLRLHTDGQGRLARDSQDIYPELFSSIPTLFAQ